MCPVVDQSDWETLSLLKKHLDRQKKLNVIEYVDDIARDQEHFNYFRDKVLVK
jgi:hypothetical protein